MLSRQRFVCLFVLAAGSCLLLQGCDWFDKETSSGPEDNKDNEMAEKWEKHIDKVCDNECKGGDDCVKHCKATHRDDMTDEEKEEWVANMKVKCGAICEPEESRVDGTATCPITVTPSEESSCEKCNKCIKKHDQPRILAKQMEVQRLHKMGRAEERDRRDKRAQGGEAAQDGKAVHGGEAVQGGEESPHGDTCLADVKPLADELRTHGFDDYVCNKYIWQSGTISLGFKLFMCTEERKGEVFVSKDEERALRHAVDKAHDDIFRSPESRAKIGFDKFYNGDLSIENLRKEVATELVKKSFDARKADLPESRWTPEKMDQLMEYTKNFLYSLVKKGCLLDVCQELCPTSPSTPSRDQQSPAITGSENSEDEDSASAVPAQVDQQTSLAQRRASRSRALDAFISTAGRVQVDHRHSAHRHSQHGHSEHRHSEHRHPEHRHAIPGEPPLRHHRHHRRHAGEDFADGIDTISALLQKQAAESELDR